MTEDLNAEISTSITNLTDAQAAEAAARAARAAAVERILGLVAEMRKQAEHQHDRAYLAVVRHLYWHHLTIPSNDLTDAAGFRYPAEMLAAIGSVPSGIVCDVCGEEMVRTSRSWKPPTRHYSGLLRCDSCQRADQQAYSRKRHLENLRAAHVMSGTVAAPVADWLVAVRLVLAYPPISVYDPEDDYGYSHWRSYELAQEADQRISSASATHATIPVDQATRILKIANKVIGWDIGRTWDVVTPITSESPTLILTRLERRVDEVREQRKAEAFDLYPDDYTPPNGWPY